MQWRVILTLVGQEFGRKYIWGEEAGEGVMFHAAFKYKSCDIHTHGYCRFFLSA